MTARGWLRRVAGLAAIAAASVAVSLAAAEGLLRLTGFSYPLFHVPDELTGLALRPGAEGWYRDEGEAFVRINARGWRDIDRPVSRHPKTVRIAVLGDSFTEALQVPAGEAFPALLERELDRCAAFGERPVEVLNFGVAGSGTAQQLLTLRHRVWAYDPQLVLLAFFPANDVVNNSPRLERWAARPFLRRGASGFFLDVSFRDDPAFRDQLATAPWHAAIADLRLAQLLRRVRDGAYGGWRQGGLGEPGLQEQVFVPHAAGDWAEAWEITEALVTGMHEEARSRGARFLVASLTTGAMVYPDAQKRARFAAALGVPDLLYPERRLGALGAQAGFDVVALGEPMQRHAELTGEYLHGFANTRAGSGHWNRAGHRVAADLLAQHFCAGRYNPAP
jgi:hypothetical protein